MKLERFLAIIVLSNMALSCNWDRKKKLKQNSSDPVVTSKATTEDAGGGNDIDPEEQKELLEKKMIENLGESAEVQASFKAVKEILKADCESCHSPSGQASSSDFTKFTSPEELIASPYVSLEGPLKSSLYFRLQGSKGSSASVAQKNMPIDSALSKEKLETIYNWLDLIREEVKTDLVMCDEDSTAPSPFSVNNKVKRLLTGFPVNSAEISEIMASEQKMVKDHIYNWLDTTEANDKFERLFATLLQQDAFTVDLIGDKYLNSAFTRYDIMDHIVSGLKLSVAKTAVHFVNQDRAFTEILTTNQFMLTPGLMAYIAFVNMLVDDGEEATRPANSPIPGSTFWVANREISPANSVDPNHPDFMKFSHPRFETCFENGVDEFRNGNGGRLHEAFAAMTGNFRFTSNKRPSEIRNDCDPGFLRNLRGVMNEDDFEDWKLVTIRPPKDGESVHRFFDLAQFRSGNELIVDLPYVGFFTFPAFQLTWETNEGNDHRVSINQALIAALGDSFDGEDSIIPQSIDGLLDEAHASPNTECYSCHKTMDPMRQFFRQSFTYNGLVQRDASISSVSGLFAYGNMEKTGNGVADLGKFMAEHPRFAGAWVQKMCTWANSKPCDADSAVFLKIADNFRKNGYKFKDMMVDLMSSPLVTGESCSMGRNVSIARAEQLCSHIFTRLDIDVNFCSQLNFDGDSSGEQNARNLLRKANIINAIPELVYPRGVSHPTYNTDSDMFFFRGAEIICEEVGSYLEQNNRPPFNLENDAFVASLTSDLVGLVPADPRYDELAPLLKNELQQRGKESAFIAACLSPGVIGIGF